MSFRPRAKRINTTIISHYSIFFGSYANRVGKNCNLILSIIYTTDGGSVILKALLNSNDWDKVWETTVSTPLLLMIAFNITLPSNSETSFD